MRMMASQAEYDMESLLAHTMAYTNHQQDHTSAAKSLGAAAARVAKRRSRASRRPPITILETDCMHFRDIVQKLTGIPPANAPKVLPDIHVVRPQPKRVLANMRHLENPQHLPPSQYIDPQRLHPSVLRRAPQLLDFEYMQQLNRSYNQGNVAYSKCKFEDQCDINLAPMSHQSTAQGLDGDYFPEMLQSTTSHSPVGHLNSGYPCVF